MRYTSAVLITENFDELKRFYTHVMRLPVSFDFGRCLLFEGGLSIWRLEDTDPASRYGAYAGKNEGLELCFETEEFDTDTAQIQASGVRLMHSVSEESWGQRTMRFFDPDGNLIELGESIPAFCKRLFAQGLKPMAVAEKTGVPPELVEKYIRS